MFISEKVVFKTRSIAGEWERIFHKYGKGQSIRKHTVQVRNRFKGLDLIECPKNYGQRFVTLYKRQGSRPSP